MINFKVSGLSDGLITVTKPLGKPIPLNVGEIVKGEVMDLLSTGAVTLRIKGSFITAKTDIPLQKDTQVMLKVIGTTSSPSELKLQFMGLAEKEESPPQQPKGETLNKFLQQFISPGNDTPIPAEKIESLLKLLPSDIAHIPKDIRIQLQIILQDSLRATGQDIQSRLDQLLKSLPDGLKDQPIMKDLKLEVAASIDKLLSDSSADNLKSLLRDTGIALESKLKTVAELLQQSKGLPGSEAAGVQKMDQALIGNDLKANLLRLKDAIVSGNSNDISFKTAAASVDGMLRDIETYQLLSRTTQSFYTFLPVGWQELRDGEIAFSQGRETANDKTFSCRLNLDLEDYGKLVIMVLSHNKEFFVSFKPENDDFKMMLAGSINKLEAQFAGKGLNLKGLRVLDKDDMSLEQLENLEPYDRIINIKV
ncbi:MAG TPA: flagellar hook-length control protein FliK [Dissulfurispiraceae bacterium]|nr:flagellar hook-length control protein FliK [Dissulfurispiraceae bacterium]